MPLTVLTDHAAITARLDERLAADPVRATVLGTIRASLETTAWAAVGADGLAARSSASYPVTLAGTWSAAERSELGGLLRTLGDVRGLGGPSDDVAVLADVVAGGRAQDRMAQRLYRLDELTPPAAVPGSARLMDPADRELVIAWYAAFLLGDLVHDPLAARAEATERVDGGGEFWLWCAPDGAPVSLAARRTPQFGSARVGPVYTPPEERGHGYGSGATAAATASILADGAVPVLFTDLANPTSNKIYQQLGYYPVEDRLLVTLH